MVNNNNKNNTIKDNFINNINSINKSNNDNTNITNKDDVNKTNKDIKEKKIINNNINNDINNNINDKKINNNINNNNINDKKNIIKTNKKKINDNNSKVKKNNEKNKIRNKHINNEKDITNIFQILKEFVIDYQDPLIEQLREIFNDLSCFEILIATILSLRSRDPVTFKVYSNLRKHAKTPQEILDLSTEELESIIRSIGFYHNKAKTIKFISNYLIDNHKGEVPKTHEELLKIKGVGRKTANLVMTMCYEGNFICVDTHVHRLTNRLFINTKDANETEFELMKIFPKNEWNNINLALVKFGQNHCLVFTPKCKTCPVYDYCNYEKKKSK